MTTDISVGVRWDPIAQHEVIDEYEFDYDGGNSSSRLFERSRIKALAGEKTSSVRMGRFTFKETIKMLVVQESQ